MSGTISFGILGVAHHHSRLFAKIIKRMHNARLVGVYDPVSTRAKDFSNQFGIHTYTNLDEFISGCDLDVGVVTCENSMKKEMAIRLASARKHVLCVKPLRVNSQQSIEIIRACKKSGVRLEVGLVARHSREAAEAKERIKAGKIGKVVFAKVENRVDRGAVKTLSPWLTKKALAGGGAILEHSVHAADIARFLIGSEIKSVYAVSSPNLDLVFEAEDNFTLLMKFENGAIAMIDGSYCRQSSIRSIDMIGRVMGTRGDIYFSIGNHVINEVAGEEPSTKIGVHATGLGDWYEGAAAWNMIADMISCIRNELEPLADGSAGDTINRIVEASYKSLRIGKIVHLK